MKKLIAILFAVVILATLPLTAFAATGINEYEQQILDKLESTHVMGKNGWDFSVPQEYINTAKNFFAGDGDVTEEQMNQILAYIDDGMQIVKEEADAQNYHGTEYHLNNMSQEARNEVLALGQAACKEVELDLVYDAKDHHVVITPVGSNTPVFESAPIVKTTGEDFPVNATVIVASVVAAVFVGAAAMFVISKKNGLFSA